MVSIIVLDDNDDVRDEVVELLTLTGFAVRGFRCASEALTAVAAQKPDIMILDVRMPDMDGFQVLEKAMPLHPSLEVIMASGYVDEEMEARAKQMGAFLVLHKPLAVEAIIGAVKMTKSFSRG